LAYYRAIIALRNAHPALQTGTIRTLLTEDQADVWAFLRSDREEQLIVVLNASDAARDCIVPVPLNAPSAWKALLGATGSFTVADHKLPLRVPAVSGVVLHAATPK
jgi:glycosidase